MQSRFGSAPDGWGWLDYYVWTKHIQPNLPKFAYFDDYRLLPDKVNLPTLLQRQQQQQLNDEDRTVLALLRMARVNAAQLAQPSTYEVAKAQLEGLCLVK